MQTDVVGSRELDYNLVCAWLEMYHDAMENLAAQEERFERLRNRMEQVGSPAMTDMPRNPSPDTDKMTEAVILKMQIMDAIREQNEFIIKMRGEIEALLRFCTVDEKRVIWAYDIDGMNWDYVARMFYGDRDDYELKLDSYKHNVQRYRRTAILKFVDAMNGVESAEFPSMIEVSKII